MTRQIGLAGFAAMLAAFTLPVLAQQPTVAQATMGDASGAIRGTATFRQMPNGVLIDLDFAGLPPNAVMAIHVHEKGMCDAATGFKGAGGHFNPHKAEHGYGATHGIHAGDMPNQFVASDGRLRSQIINTGISLGQGTASVFDTDGSALVLHTKPDDYKSQPTGDAGDRALCGVIEKAR